MTKVMPQEIEVWYLLPALRRELAKIFVTEYNLTQKEAAEILGMTESAISQYLKLKRGTDYQFNQKESKLIKEAAKKILDNKGNITKYIYDLSLLFKGSKALCELHRKHDQDLPSDCSTCMDD